VNHQLHDGVAAGTHVDQSLNGLAQVGGAGGLSGEVLSLDVESPHRPKRHHGGVRSTPHEQGALADHVTRADPRDEPDLALSVGGEHVCLTGDDQIDPSTRLAEGDDLVPPIEIPPRRRCEQRSALRGRQAAEKPRLEEPTEALPV
jgi:hypothetical protein